MDTRFNSLFTASFNPNFDPIGEITTVGKARNTELDKSRHQRHLHQKEEDEEETDKNKKNNKKLVIDDDYVPNERLYPKPQRAPSRQTGAIVFRHYDSAVVPFDARATQREAIRRGSPLSVAALTSELMETDEQRMKRHRLVPITVGLESEYWQRRLERHKRRKEMKKIRQEEERRRALREAGKRHPMAASSSASSGNIFSAQLQASSSATVGAGPFGNGNDDDDEGHESDFDSDDSGGTSSSSEDPEDYRRKVETLILSMKTGRKSITGVSLDAIIPHPNESPGDRKRRRKQEKEEARRRREEESAAEQERKKKEEGGSLTTRDFRRRSIAAVGGGGDGGSSPLLLSPDQTRKQRALAAQEAQVATARLALRETGVRGMQRAKGADRMLDMFANPWQNAARSVEAKRDALLFSGSNTAHMGRHKLDDALANAAARDQMVREKKEKDMAAQVEKEARELRRRQEEQIRRGEMPSMMSAHPSPRKGGGGGGKGLSRSSSSTTMLRSNSNLFDQSLSASMIGGGGGGSGSSLPSPSGGGRHAQRMLEESINKKAGSSSVTIVESSAQKNMLGSTAPSDFSRSTAGGGNGGEKTGAGAFSSGAEASVYPHCSDDTPAGSPMSRVTSLGGDTMSKSLLLSSSDVGAAASSSMMANSAFPLHRNVTEKKFRKTEEAKKINEFYDHLLPADVQYRARASRSQILHDQRQQVLKKYSRKQWGDDDGLEPASKTEILVNRIMMIHNSASGDSGSGGGGHQVGIPQLSGAHSGLAGGGLLQLNIQTQSRYVTRAAQSQQQRSQSGLTLADVRSMRDEFTEKGEFESLRLIQSKMTTSTTLGQRMVGPRDVKAALQRSDGVTLRFDNLLRAVYGVGAKAVPVTAINTLLEELKQEDEIREAHHPYSFRRFCTVATAKDIEQSFAAMVDYVRGHFGGGSSTSSNSSKRRQRVSVHGEIGVTQQEYCAFLRRSSTVPVSEEQAIHLFRQHSVPQGIRDDGKNRGGRASGRHRNSSVSSNNKKGGGRFGSSSSSVSFGYGSTSRAQFGDDDGEEDDDDEISSSDAESVPSDDGDDVNAKAAALKKKNAERAKLGLPPIKASAVDTNINGSFASSSSSPTIVLPGSPSGSVLRSSGNKNNKCGSGNNDDDASSVSSWASSCSTCAESWSSGSQCAGSAFSSRASSSDASSRRSNSSSSSSGGSEVVAAPTGVFVMNNNNCSSSDGNNKSSSKKDRKKKMVSDNKKQQQPQHQHHSHKRHKPSVPHWQLPTESTATPSLPRRPMDEGGNAKHRPHRVRPRLLDAHGNSGGGGGGNDHESRHHRQRHRHHHHHRKHRVVKNKENTGGGGGSVALEALKNNMPSSSIFGSKRRMIRRKYIMTVEEWALLLLPSLKAKIDELKSLHKQQQEKDSVFLRAAAQSGISLPGEPNIGAMSRSASRLSDHGSAPPAAMTTSSASASPISNAAASPTLLVPSPPGGGGSSRRGIGRAVSFVANNE